MALSLSSAIAALVATDCEQLREVVEPEEDEKTVSP